MTMLHWPPDTSAALIGAALALASFIAAALGVLKGGRR